MIIAQFVELYDNCSVSGIYDISSVSGIVR